MMMMMMMMIAMMRQPPVYESVVVACLNIRNDVMSGVDKENSCNAVPAIWVFVHLRKITSSH